MIIQVSMCLKGDQLDPNRITQLLGLIPSDTKVKGQKDVTSTKKVVTAKTGLWRFSTYDELKSTVFAEHLEFLRSRFASRWKDIAKLPNVQEAYVDVFIAINEEKDNKNTAYFGLTAANLSDLQQLGLPMRFEVAVIAKRGVAS